MNSSINIDFVLINNHNLKEPFLVLYYYKPRIKFSFIYIFINKIKSTKIKFFKIFLKY